MAGDLIESFRRTIARIALLEKNIKSEQVELVALRSEVDELRTILTAERPKTAAVEALLRPARKRPIRQSSTVGYAKRVLQMVGGPMYVDEIIKNIEHMTGLPVNKATLVSSLSRYVKAGDTFKRTAANTFALMTYEEPEKEIRLVG